MPYSPVGAIGLFTEEPEEQCVCSLGERWEILFQVLVQQEKKDKLTSFTCLQVGLSLVWPNPTLLQNKHGNSLMVQSRDGAHITHATPLLSRNCYRIIYQVHHVHRKSWKWWCAKYIGKAYQEPKFVKLEALLWRLQRHRVAPKYLKDYSLFAASLLYFFFFFFFFFFFLFTSMSNLGKSSHQKCYKQRMEFRC